MPALNAHAVDQPVAVFLYEVRDVDRSERIGRLDPEPAARTHAGKSFACFQHGQGTIQSPEVVNVGASGQLPNMLPKRLRMPPNMPGFPSAGWAGTT